MGHERGFELLAFCHCAQVAEAPAEGQDDEPHRCDVCADTLDAADGQAVDGDYQGFDVQGRGLLVWSRGEERRYQEPPLCASCATAIGVSALQRWEIEEEEG